MTQMSEKSQREQEMQELAMKIWGLSRDKLLVNLRFLDVALSSLRFEAKSGTGMICCDVSTLEAATVLYGETSCGRQRRAANQRQKSCRKNNCPEHHCF